MTRDEAMQRFYAGRFHPHCPACGEQNLFVAGAKLFANRSGQRRLVRVYICTRCQDRFIAWIDEHGEEKENTRSTRETAAYESASDLGTVEENGSVDVHV